MQIKDSSEGHRKITLAANEALDSTTIIAALVKNSHLNRKQATAFVGFMMDALEG